MILPALIAIIVLFILIAMGKAMLENAMRMKLCALCASVALAWLGMLVLSMFNIEVDKTALAILMGESVAGIMFKIAFATKEQGMSSLKGLLIILIGTVAAYFIIERRVEVFSLVLIGILFLGGIILSSYTKGSGKASKELLKKLERCCS